MVTGSGELRHHVDGTFFMAYQSPSGVLIGRAVLPEGELGNWAHILHEDIMNSESLEDAQRREGKRWTTA